MKVVPLSAELVPKWDELFRRASCPCHCRYWGFAGTKNDWLERCATAPEKNAEEQGALVRQGDPEAGGLVALSDDGEVVGWMRLGPRPAKLRALSVYRSLPLEDAGVFAIGCFLVDPGWRTRGVVRALLAAAPAFARERGAHAIEAYPRKSDVRLSEDEAWMGPFAALVAAGFEQSAEAFATYPVLRLRVT